MDLYSAFGVEPGAVVSVVGGGGKTSLVHALAQGANRRGLSAIVTTTVRFTRPPGIEMPPVVTAPEDAVVDAVRSRLMPGETVVASSGHGTHGRLQGFDPTTVDGLAELGAGLVAVEADGSSHRPFKAPAEHEPVIARSTTDVVVCVGLPVIGQPLGETWVHRPELVAGITRQAQGEVMTLETVAKVLLHDAGGRKGVPEGGRLHALLNNPGDDERAVPAMALAELLVSGGYERVVVATAHEDRVWAVLG